MTLIPVQRIHLSLPRGESVCGTPAQRDTALDSGDLTPEINEATCPTCLRLHDRMLAPFA